MRIINLMAVDTKTKAEVGFMPNPKISDKEMEWEGFKSYFELLNRDNMYLGTIDPEQDPEYDGRYMRRLIIEKGADAKDNDLVVINYQSEYWVKRLKAEIDKIDIDSVTNIEQPFITEYDAKYHFGVVRMIEKVIVNY